MFWTSSPVTVEPVRHAPTLPATSTARTRSWTRAPDDRPMLTGGVATFVDTQVNAPPLTLRWIW